jgi:hypothetical protein
MIMGRNLLLAIVGKFNLFSSFSVALIVAYFVLNKAIFEFFIFSGNCLLSQKSNRLEWILLMITSENRCVLWIKKWGIYVF